MPQLSETKQIREFEEEAEAGLLRRISTAIGVPLLMFLPFTVILGGFTAMLATACELTHHLPIYAALAIAIGAILPITMWLFALTMEWLGGLEDSTSSEG